MSKSNWRSERLNSRGWTRYWYVYCPDCGEQSESASYHLQQGCRPCACSNQRQKECYINWVIDDHNNAVGIKFGIARDSKQRVKQQNTKSAYSIAQYQVYTFPSVAQCKAAERECNQTLDCGVVLKRDMPDGYSETTWTYNLRRVVGIYEKYGGVLSSDSDNVLSGDDVLVYNEGL